MKGSVVLTADGKVLHCSPSWLVAAGETEDNVVGHVLLEHATDCTPAPAILLDQLRRGEASIHCSWHQQSRSGDVLTCTADLRVLDGSPCPRPIFTAHITVDSKSSDGPTAASKGDEHSCDVAYTVADMSDEKQLLTFVSPGFVALTGYEPRDCLGRNCNFLQGPASEAEAVGALRHAVRQHAAVRVTVTNHRKDGTQFLNRLVLHPLLVDGVCRAMLGIQYALPDAFVEAKLQPVPLLEELEAVARRHQAMAGRRPAFQLPLGVGMVVFFLFSVLMLAGFCGLAYATEICEARQRQTVVVSEAVFNSTVASFAAALSQVVALTETQHQRLVAAAAEAPANRTYALQQYELTLRSVLDGLPAGAAGVYFLDGRAVYLLKAPGWLVRCTAQGFVPLAGAAAAWALPALELCTVLQAAVVQWDGAGGSGWVPPLAGGSTWVYAMGVPKNVRAANRTGTIVTALLTDYLELGSYAASPPAGSATAVVDSMAGRVLASAGDPALLGSATTLSGSLQGSVASFQTIASSRRYVVAQQLGRFGFSFATVYISTPTAACGITFTGLYGLGVWYTFTGLLGLGMLYMIFNRHCTSVVRALRHARRFDMEAAFAQVTMPSLARFISELWCQREWALQMCQQLELWRHFAQPPAPTRPRGRQPEEDNVDDEDASEEGGEDVGKGTSIDPSAKYLERRPSPTPAIRDEWRVATVMHASLQGFVTLSGQLDRHTFLELHRQYVDALHACVVAARGTFHHFVGDRVLASWNTVTEAKHAEQQACRAAVDSVAATRLINRRMEGTALSLHVGLAKGPVLAAVMGCPRYRSFNLLGPACDRARDIGRLNWVLGTHVLAEDAVAQGSRLHFEMRIADVVALPDAPDDALLVHEVRQPLRADGPMPRPYPVLPRLYAEAVERYLARDVGGCKALLVRFLEDFHDDGPARMFLWAAHRPVQPPDRIIHPLDAIPQPQDLGVEL
eukprot:EG_transcript_1852